MFLHVLEGEERDLFAEVAWALIHVDEDVDTREEALLAELQTEMGLDAGQPELWSWDALEPRLRHLESPTVRRVVLLELCGVATADGEVRDHEGEFLTNAAAALRLADATVEEFLEYVGRAHLVWQEGRELVLEASSEELGE